MGKKLPFFCPRGSKEKMFERVKLLKKCPRGVNSLKKMSEGSKIDGQKLSEGGRMCEKTVQGGLNWPKNVRGG